MGWFLDRQGRLSATRAFVPGGWWKTVQASHALTVTAATLAASRCERWAVWAAVALARLGGRVGQHAKDLFGGVPITEAEGPVTLRTE